MVDVFMSLSSSSASASCQRAVLGPARADEYVSGSPFSSRFRVENASGTAALLDAEG